MVHYIGDKTVAEDLPHGNIKNREVALPYKRSLPSAHRAAKLILRSSELVSTEEGLQNDSDYPVKVNKHTIETRCDLSKLMINFEL